MKKCLRILVTATFPGSFLSSFVQKHARELNLEGTVQLVAPDQMRIIVCGEKESVDQFLDLCHKGDKKWHADAITTEPFIKDKDYRGVFRVIE